MNPTRLSSPEPNRVLAALLALSSLLILALPACTSSKLPRSSPTAKASEAAKTDETSTSFYISNVPPFAYTGTSGTPKGTVSLSFDRSRSSAAVSDSCASPGTSGVSTLPCVCKFSWTEINSSSGTAVSISRSVQTKATSIQPYSVICDAPNHSLYKNEILDGTTIKITFAPGTGNTNYFISNIYNYTKTTSSTSGSFQDEQGHYFDNILRYSCYEQFKRGMSLSSKIVKIEDTETGERLHAPMASQFCVKRVGGATGGATEGCETLGEIENSAQAYYYNLYVRDSESGSINVSNARYICPRVQEYLPGGSQATSIAYPLDTSFALSLDRTSDFTVGIEANTKVSIGGEPTSQASSCTPSGDGARGGVAGNDTLIRSCLGFATKPAQDGTCPTFRLNTGQIKPTYRLRRFIALYPPVFDTNGSPYQAQATDTIFVLDRPVKGPVNTDPNKPYTMRGPKPCPFSFFDKKGVVGLTDARYPNSILPTYAATNNTAWKGTNIDGIEFPNKDAPNSCSAVLPVLSRDRSILTLATVNSANPVYKHAYVRPVQPWSPHYVEDTAFEACAPQADPPRDPPLHFAKDLTTGNVGWCAEVYPTQNDNISKLDTTTRIAGVDTYIGGVSPYTSHAVKNSLSQECTRTLPSIPSSPAYAAAANNACPAVGAPDMRFGVARHPTDFVVDRLVDKDGNASNICSNKTCDRTVVNPGAIIWPSFPLLATAYWTEQAIISDTTYACTITYDAGGGKTGSASPSDGCCGTSVKLVTGYSSSSSYVGNLAAHLEPDINCQIPKY